MTAVDFRCEQCGKLLSVEAEPGSLVPCPHCQKKVAVPAGLASLPRPQVPGAAAGAAAPPPPPPPAPDAPVEDQPVGEESKFAGIMSVIMPFVLSVFLHAGVGLILLFFGVAIQRQAVAKDRDLEDIAVPGEYFAKTHNLSLRPGEVGPSPEAAQNKKDTAVTGYSSHEALMSTGNAKEGKEMSLIGSATGGGAAGGGYAKFALTSGGGGGGPRVGFLQSSGNAHHVVFVIDNSGSLATASVFDHVKLGMRQSLGKLAEEQDFHMIFFCDNRPNQKRVPWGFPNPPRLLPASKEYKMDAARWLEDVIADGKASDPRPAIEQAFKVLAVADKKPGKMIFLLTDGDFQGTDNATVLRRIKELSSGAPDVVIFTYLYGNGASDDFIKVMQQIAEVTHGKFKHIQE